MRPVREPRGALVRSSLAVAHVAVPFGLGWARRRALIGAGAVGATYDSMTVVLGALALLSPAAGPTSSPARSDRRRLTSAVVGAFAGAALPVVAAAANPARGAAPTSAATASSRTQSSGAVVAARTALVAGAEEVIWRRGSVRPSAAVLRLVGFVALHVPRSPRTARYHVLTGLLFEAVARRGGVLAATCAHTAHNLAIEIRSARGAPPGGAPPGGAAVADEPLPPTNEW